MKQIFEEYGKCIIAALTTVAMIGLCSVLIIHGDTWNAMMNAWTMDTREYQSDHARLTEALAENEMDAEYLASVTQLENVDINSQINIRDRWGNVVTVSGINSRDKYEEPGIYEIFFSYLKPNGRRDYGSVKFPVQRLPMEDA